MEDAAMLAAQTVPASHLALIDSGKRDVAHWPTPSRFDVPFDTPFHMVYGVDLLGVTIPRTEYNVSSSRNCLNFAFGSGQPHTALVTPGDYDASTLVTAINTALGQFVSRDNNTVTVASAGPSSNQLVFTCAEAFTFYLSSSSLRAVIGMNYPVDPADTGYTAPGWVPGAPDTVYSALAPKDASKLLAFPGATDGLSELKLLGQRGVEQTFVSTYSGVVTGVGALLKYVGTDIAPVVYWSVMDLDRALIGSGVITADFDTPNQQSTGSYSQILGQVVAGQGYILQLSDPNNSDANNCTTVCYGSTSVENAVSLTSGGNSVDGVLCTTVTVQTTQYVVAPPGLVDLTGERYIVLRCLELETAINGSRAFEGFNAGVGYITLGTYGYSQQSYDYTAYPPRSFQPIPSLYKLSLSFEKPDGTLYDFKGLNLQLLLLIRYLVPKQLVPSNTNTPHYKSYLPHVDTDMLQSTIQHDGRYNWCPQSSQPLRPRDIF